MWNSLVLCSIRPCVFVSLNACVAIPNACKQLIHFDCLALQIFCDSVVRLSQFCFAHRKMLNSPRHTTLSALDA